MINALYHEDYYIHEKFGSNHDWLLSEEERKEVGNVEGEYVDHPLTFHTRVSYLFTRSQSFRHFSSAPHSLKFINGASISPSLNSR